MRSREEYAKMRLDHGAEFPYDRPDDEDAPIPPATDWAHAAARGVISDLEDRRDIKHGFIGVDEETRAEIVRSLADIIRQAKG